jgi:hypothetical protein
MKLARIAALLLLFAGCATHQGTGGSDPSTSRGAQPVVKKELPWLEVFGGRMRTTFFYGPWQCRQDFMTECQRECAQQARQLMGCMWLADIKMEWEGHLVVPPLPVNSGGRLAITHCCCNYNTLTPRETKAQRKRWENIRTSFRESWSKKFGNWPTEEGVSWPGHHIRALQHGGDPIDPSNVIPTQPGVHDVFSEQYPLCYAGQAPWNIAGPYWPYMDN